MTTLTFDNHSAFDDLTSAFEAMDRSVLNAAPRSSEPRTEWARCPGHRAFCLVH